MKWLSLAISSLGVWVFLISFVDSDWPYYVFGAITAVFAFIAAYTNKE